jgi:L-amino acid N-acyltransferase YncA
MIKTLQNDIGIINISELAGIVEKQMKIIGSKHNIENIINAINNALKNNRTIFFIKNNEKGKIIGFAFGNICSELETGADYLWINELYFDNEYRNKGIATELYEYIENWIKNRNIKYIAAITKKGNEASISFHKKMKFDTEEKIWIDKTIE